MKIPIVSVVIPTYNSAVYLESCLQSIKHQSYEEIELIVVDNESTDATKEIARKYTNLVYEWRPERSAQRNYGVKQATGDYIFIIDSDMELSENVVKSCVETVLTDTQLKALIIPEESFGEGFWSQCKKLERSFYNGIDWQEAPRFFNKQVYEDLGGYDEKITGWEDYDLPNRLEDKYGKQSLARIKDLIYHNERKLTLVISCKKKFYYALTLDYYIQKPANKNRLYKQSSILRRYAVFFAHPNKLFKNPFLGIGMLCMKTCEFGAGAVGYITGKLKRISLIGVQLN